jgi:formate dehydrogenase (coenzyme F420) alpha subunit
MEVYVDNGKVIKIEGQKDHPLNKGYLCPKGRTAIEHLYHPDRLKYPLKKVNGRWERVSWDQALTEISGKLNELSNKYDPSVNAFFCEAIGPTQLTELTSVK